MEKKHTVGEWNIERSGPITYPNARIEYCVESDTGWIIAQVRGDNNEQAMANASLISAAPELFEALQAAADDQKEWADYLEFQIESFGGAERDMLVSAHQAAKERLGKTRKALTKAEGGQQ